MNRTVKTAKGRGRLMFTAIRKRMTYANVAMTLALVFAMTGGALAASHKGKHAQRHKKSGVTITSTKQISQSVLAALKGNTGPAGPQGPAGAAGTAGAKGETGLEGKAGKDGTNGTNGKNGTNGTNGLSVVMTELAKGSTECEEGGEEFSVGTEKGKACNGSNGGGTLKKGETETGVWAVDMTGYFFGKRVYGGHSAVTYPRPMLEGGEVPNVIPQGGAPTANCPGSLRKPEAAEGYLCLYTEYSENVSQITVNVKEGGFLVAGFAETATNEGTAFGTWAVTAQ